MYFKGTIVITDPCYIIKKNPVKHPNPEDFNLPNSIKRKKFTDYSTPDEFAYKAACDKYFKKYPKYDDWWKCGAGEKMEVLGIHNYFTRETKYSKWSYNTYEVEGDPKEAVNDWEYYNLYTIFDTPLDSNPLEYKTLRKNIGSFCTDVGLVSVFLLDEIITYNPDWVKTIEKNPQLATTIKDYEGEVKYYIDKVIGDIHIIGDGNIKFYTTQTLI